MLHYRPSREQCVALCDDASAVTVYCSLLSDQLTPVSAFERLAPAAGHAFLLESVVGGEKIARYSFLGSSPFSLVEASGDKVVVTSPVGQEIHDGRDPLKVLEECLSRHRVIHPAGLPRFLGGAVGYAGYDLARHYERLGTPPRDDRQLPDLQFGLYDEMVVFDHVRKLVHVVAHAHTGNGVDGASAYDKACSSIEAIVARLEEDRREPLKPMIPPASDDPPCDSNLTSEEFEHLVDRCKDYIRAGEILQVVISQRLSAVTCVAPFDIYRALRVVNPSPFMFYLQSPSVTLVGASPEILCRLEGRTVYTRPLAGTRPRGQTAAEDLGLQRELLADPKERAEHVMLVDLGRNDLGRICQAGSVKVDDLFSVERYSHVMHLCSGVSGTLERGKSAFDALRSVLPVGTVSGAPKIRAMQIIDELETVRRGAYAGAVGYIDFSGNMDTCIALRTLVVTPASDGKHRVDAHVGAGIVADSEPALEYGETLSKAQSMLSALQIASAWRDALR
ncbi:MAG: anthranilate synthase component I [Phycisphaerae bacterium]